MAAENYNIDRRLLDGFEALLGGKKDSRILDVAAGTGLVGVEVRAIPFEIPKRGRITKIPTPPPTYTHN